MRQLRRRAHPRGSDRGASAVEFALLAPLMILLVFGIIDYGLWFSDSLATRQGVREAARQGVVANFGTTTDCGLDGVSGASENIRKLMCTTHDRTGAITGDTRVMVKLPQGWQRGAPLIVCSQMKASAGTGLVPLPNDRIIQSRVEMSIEQIVGVSNEAGGFEQAPAGGNWSWC